MTRKSLLTFCAGVLNFGIFLPFIWGGGGVTPLLTIYQFELSFQISIDFNNHCYMCALLHICCDVRVPGWHLSSCTKYVFSILERHSVPIAPSGSRWKVDQLSKHVLMNILCFMKFMCILCIVSRHIIFEHW